MDIRTVVEIEIKRLEETLTQMTDRRDRDWAADRLMILIWKLDLPEHQPNLKRFAATHL